jgi:hypothetical protein
MALVKATNAKKGTNAPRDSLLQKMLLSSYSFFLSMIITKMPNSQLIQNGFS